MLIAGAVGCRRGTRRPQNWVKFWLRSCCEFLVNPSTNQSILELAIADAFGLFEAEAFGLVDLVVGI